MQRIIAFVKANLTPNRITVYLTVAVNLTTALLAAASDLGLDSTVSVVAGLAGVNAVAIKFLHGWQKFEAANYQADLINLQYSNETAARETSLSQAVGKPKVRLPR